MGGCIYTKRQDGIDGGRGRRHLRLGLCNRQTKVPHRNWTGNPSPGARWEPLFTAIRDVGQKAEPVGAGWVWVDRTGRDTVRALSPDSAAMASNLSENDQCLVFEVATPEGMEKLLAMSKWFAINLDIGHFTAGNNDAAVLQVLERLECHGVS